MDATIQPLLSLETKSSNEVQLSNGPLSSGTSKVLPPLYHIEMIDLQFKVTLLPYLIHVIEKSIINHLQLAWKKKEWIQNITVHLYCSQNKRMAVIKIEPERPSREFRSFSYPLEKQISQIHLKAPVQKIELEVLRQF